MGTACFYFFHNFYTKYIENCEVMTSSTLLFALFIWTVQEMYRRKLQKFKMSLFLSDLHNIFTVLLTNIYPFF